MNNFDIDFDLLIKAINFYTEKGYKPISAPLLVDEDIIKVTTDRKPLKNNGLCFVGSAEQSFLQLLKNGAKISDNFKYMLISPCQRNEPTINEQHLNIFLKIELISKCSNMFDAFDFFHSVMHGNDIEFVNFEKDITDININGIEVGSYGKRFYNDVIFHFGTGLALPRFTLANNS